MSRVCGGREVSLPMNVPNWLGIHSLAGGNSESGPRVFLDAHRIVVGGKAFSHSRIAMFETLKRLCPTISDSALPSDPITFTFCAVRRHYAGLASS